MPTFLDTNHLLSSFSRLKALIVGDVMIDRYLTGKMTRISPEAPVPVVEWIQEENRLGGAANVALNVAALGAKAFLCGGIGNDGETDLFFGLLKDTGLDASLIVTLPGRPTTLKTRVLADGRHLLRLDRESRLEISPSESAALASRLSDFLATQPIDVIILQDYNKGLLSPSLIKTLLKLADTYRIPVAVDPKFHHFWDYQGVQLFKPNLKEVRDAVPFSVEPTKTSLEEAAAYILEKNKANQVLITLSEHGAFISDGSDAHLLPALKRQVLDVSGAGDAVIAATALGLTLGLQPIEIGQLANLAGGQVVEKVGVVPIDLRQLAAEGSI